MLFTFFFYFDTAKIYTFFYLPTILVGKCAIFLKIIFIITENQQLILTKKWSEYCYSLHFTVFSILRTDYFLK